MSEVVNLGKVCMTAEGNYDPSRSYDKLAVVAYNGLSWVSRKKVPEGVAPSESNSAFWQKISERGERGPQGQSYMDKGLVPIVDDLTTGGSANVLSAEQGKVLKQELTELESKTRNYYKISDFSSDKPSSNVRAGLLNSGVVAGSRIIISLESSFFNEYTYELATTSTRVDMTGVNVIQDTGWMTAANKTLVVKNTAEQFAQIWFKRQDNRALYIEDVEPYILSVQIISPIVLDETSIAPKSVTSDKLADKSVTSDKLADKSVTSDKLADKSVTSDKLADLAVGKNHIKESSVSSAKMGGYDITQDIVIPQGATSGVVVKYDIESKTGDVIFAELVDDDNVLVFQEDAATRPRLAHSTSQYFPIGFSYVVMQSAPKTFEIQVPFYSMKQQNGVVMGGTIRLRIFNSYAEFQKITLERFSHIAEHGSIFDFNEDVEFHNKIQQIARPTYVRNVAQVQPLVLTWFSDLHGDLENLNRLIRFKKKYSSYITDTINTGDTVSDNFDDDFSFYLNADTSKILHSIGNHEVKQNNTVVTLKGVYDKYLKPQIANWGVVQPQNAESLGLCYYYKDYADRGIRLIMFDSVLYMDYSASGIYEATWLENVLEDAIANNLSVVIATHYPTTGLLNNGFISAFNSLKDKGREYDYVGNGIIATIDTYIKKGLKFICWLSGHTHLDMVGKVAYAETLGNNQLSIVIENAGCSDGWNDSSRVVGTKSQDAFNVIAFDTYSKKIKVIRVGDDRDNFLRHKGTMCISYDTHEIIYED